MKFGVLISVLCVKVAFSAKEFPYFLLQDYCTTLECKEQGIRTSSALNKSVLPCEDFYEFSCGKWAKSNQQPNFEPIWNHWQSVKNIINTRIHDLLQRKHETNDISFLKAQLMYQTCLNSNKFEMQQLRQLRKLIEFLNGWPIGSNNWNSDGYDWISQIITATKLLGIHPILKIITGIDFKNTTNHILYIHAGDLIFPKYILTDPERHAEEISSYGLWILRTFKHLYKSQRRTKQIKDDVMNIVDFEIKLSKLSAEGLKNERMAVKELEDETKMDWTQILQTLFSDMPITVDSTGIVVVKDRKLLANTLKLIKNTEQRTVANYIMWAVVKHLSRDTTKYMKNLNFIIDKIILGVKTDVSPIQDCIDKINEHMAFAAVPQYVNSFFTSEIFSSVNNMVHNIKTEFIHLLQENKWLHTITKTRAIEKIREMKYYIGFPNWITNTTNLNEYYNKLNITNNHFLNVLRMKQHTTEKEFLKLKTHTTQIDWPSSPFEVNAYYSILQNSISKK